MIKHLKSNFMIAAVFLFVSVCPIRANDTGGVVEGVVKNSSGQPVSGAFVKLKNAERRLTFMFISQAQGRFTADKLPPGNHPFEILQVPGRVLIHFERDHLVRQIFMDGREHPKDREVNWLGHSTGRWEAGRLVVDTVGLNDLTWFDAVGHPHTDALHVVARYRRVDQDTLEDELTFDDPKAYTKPWTVRQYFKFHPDEEILEDLMCEEHLLKEHLPKVIRGPRP